MYNDVDYSAAYKKEKNFSMFNTQLHGLSKPVVGYNWYTMEYYIVFKRSDTNSRGTYLIEKSSYNSTGTV